MQSNEIALIYYILNYINSFQTTFIYNNKAKLLKQLIYW